MPFTRAMSASGQGSSKDENEVNKEELNPIITQQEVDEMIGKAIKTAITEFRSSYSALYDSKIKVLEEKVEGLEHSLDTSNAALKKENDALKKTVDTLVTNVQGLTRRLQLLDSSHNELEQYGRKNNLLFRGLLSKEGETPEQTICDFINNTLHLKDSKSQRINVSPSDIDIAHPLPGKDDKPPLMIARFARRTIKMAVIRARRTLAGKPFSISDDLTRKNQALLKSLRTNTNITDAWTWDGKIIALVNGEEKSKVFTLKDPLP